MKKLFIIFSVLSIVTLPALADIDDMRAKLSAGDAILDKYCEGGQGRINCTKDSKTGTYALGCNKTKANINQDELNADLAKFCKETSDNNQTTGTITVTGTILDENGDGLVGATAIVVGTTNGAAADINGKFTLKNVPSDAKLKFSYVGYKTQTIDATKSPTIKMVVDAQQINEVVVTGCSINKANGEKTTAATDGQCAPTACIEPRWKLNGTGKNAKCVEQKCPPEHGTGEWVANGDTYKCKIKSCDKNWKLDDDKNPTKCIEVLRECNAADKQKLESAGASKTGIKKGTETCIAQDCKCGYTLKNDKCEKWGENEPCTADTKPALPGNAKNGVLKCDGEKSYCEISDCNDGYKPSDDKKSCTSTRGDDCDATAVDPNATAGTNKKVKGQMTCVITACGKGFAPNKDGTKCVASGLTEEQSQQKVDELKENAQKMKDKEQSTANKLLGAAGIGATGIGGMQMASAMAEQNADEDAERDMRAYLATFHCNYGGGKNVKYGETDVELPGGNELIGLYSEYVNLANDLKIRKTALDMRPGIESESILDSATSGLYDDVAIGKTSGAYASLARALLDPNSADAAEWAKQKADTASKKKTGMITAGIGAAGSLVGNLVINSGDKKKEKSAEIIAKYDKLKQPLADTQKKIDAIPAKKCSEFTGTNGNGTAPNCTCSDTKNTRFSIDEGGCVKCDGDMVYNDKNECVCPADKPRNENGKCVAQIPQCQLSGLVAKGKCECITGASSEGNNNECKCTGEYATVGNTCQKKEQPIAKDTPIKIPAQDSKIVEMVTKAATPKEEKITLLTLKADTTFESGSATLTSQADSALMDLFEKIKASETDLSDGMFMITVYGYSDRVPFKRGVNKTNEQLATERANAIAKRLTANGVIQEENITTIGFGEVGCPENEYPKANDPRCRRVEIELSDLVNQFPFHTAPAVCFFR